MKNETYLLVVKNVSISMVRFICLALFLCHTVKAEDVFDLSHIHSYEDLARFISTTETNTSAFHALLNGLNSTNSIQLLDSTTIPISEICGTIIEDRFPDSLGRHFYKPGKKYGVRVICSFLDEQGEVRRYHITIFEKRQYGLLKKSMQQEITAINLESGKHNKPRTKKPLL